MGKFTFTQTEIPGVVIIEPQVFGDERGYFMETYQKDQFAAAGIDREFVQDNQSRSSRGVLRGLHFQKEHPGRAAGAALPERAYPGQAGAGDQGRGL